MKVRGIPHTDDLDMLEILGMTAEEVAAEDAAWDEFKTSMQQAFAGRLAAAARARGIDVGDLITALADHPGALFRAQHRTGGSEFGDNPVAAEKHRLAGIVDGLEAFSSIAGVVAGARAGRASGAVTTDRLAPRNEEVRRMFADTDPTLKHDAPKAEEVADKLRKESKDLMVRLGLERKEIELSPRQILRIVKGTA
jgi:hypothetical protein